MAESWLQKVRTPGGFWNTKPAADNAWKPLNTSLVYSPLASAVDAGPVALLFGGLSHWRQLATTPPSKFPRQVQAVPSMWKNDRTLNAIYRSMTATTGIFLVASIVGFQYRTYYPRWASDHEQNRGWDWSVPFIAVFITIIPSNLDVVRLGGGMQLAKVRQRVLRDRARGVRDNRKIAAEFTDRLTERAKHELARQRTSAIPGSLVLGIPLADLAHQWFDKWWRKEEPYGL